MVLKYSLLLPVTAAELFGRCPARRPGQLFPVSALHLLALRLEVLVIVASMIL
jgi:hypothetical protein